MWHSGTLAGAKQAVLLGMKGIALSTPAGKTEPNFAALEPFVEKTLALLLDNPDLSLINVNFPTEPQGIKWTRQAVQQYDGRIVPGTDPMGRKHYWFTVVPLEPAEEGTDRWAIENGFVSITPLRLDLTNEKELMRVLQKTPTPETVKSPA
jgi:5'-nucleotidase